MTDLKIRANVPIPKDTPVTITWGGSATPNTKAWMPLSMPGAFVYSEPGGVLIEPDKVLQVQHLHNNIGSVLMFNSGEQAKVVDVKECSMWDFAVLTLDRKIKSPPIAIMDESYAKLPNRGAGITCWWWNKVNAQGAMTIASWYGDGVTVAPKMGQGQFSLMVEDRDSSSPVITTFGATIVLATLIRSPSGSAFNFGSARIAAELLKLAPNIKRFTFAPDNSATGKVL